METSFLWFGVFSSSFGVRSIVLCKCSGKYIDIYFKLKITCFFYHEVLGVVAASIKSLAFLRKIHHPEGSVSALFDTSVFQIVSTVHGVRQSLLVLGSLLGSLRGSTGLHAGHGSGLEFSPQSWIRLRPYLHDWLIQASSREKVLLSLRTFLRLCNSLGIG